MLEKTARRSSRLYIVFGAVVPAILLAAGLSGSEAFAGAPTDRQPESSKITSPFQRIDAAGSKSSTRRDATLEQTPPPARSLGGTATPTPCLPATITGSITFSDPVRDMTFELNGVASSCAAPKSCPGPVEDNLNYDAYTYVNNTGSPQCYTVTVDGEMCGVGLQMGVTASTYLGSFNPNDPCANYLADAGGYTCPICNTISYSFSVPAGAQFIVVVEEIYGPFGCEGYSMTVTGAGSCGTPQPTPTPIPTVCPPKMVSGSIETGDPVTRESMDFTETSHCDTPKTCPQTIDGDFRYDTYTYTNNQSTPACVTVTLDGTYCGESFEGVFSAAYLNTFNPNNICSNYLADPGLYSDNRTGPVDYSFVVPANTTFVVMVQEVVPIVGCEHYSVHISGLDVCLTPTVTPTQPPGSTATNTPVPSTGTATRTNTPTGATPTACPMTFTDVFPTDYYYEPVRYLYCAGVISGYSDNTFRPYNTTTRGQVTKIVVLAFDIPLYTPPTPTFTDVPTTDPFYQYIETAAYNEIVSGYSDGTFRPYNNVTRGQLSKIVVVGAQWPVSNPPTPTFTDVPPQSAFYTYIETAYDRGIISGYADGTFRPGNNATRGQISKIVYEAVIAR